MTFTDVFAEVDSFCTTYSQYQVQSFSCTILKCLEIHINRQVFNELASQPPRKKSRGDSEDWRLSGASIGGKGVFKLTAQILQVFLFTFLPHLKGKKHVFAVSFSHHAIFIGQQTTVRYQLSDPTTLRSDNCQIGQLSVGTTVSGDNCQWRQLSVGQLSVETVSAFQALRQL